MRTQNKLIEASRLEQNISNACIFCNLDSNLLLGATKYFKIIVDPYPITSGHLMITSHSHYSCAGAMEKDVLNELDDLKIGLYKMLVKHYGSAAIYEHGRAGCCTQNANGQKCEHFHLHILPFSKKLNCKLSHLLGNPIYLSIYSSISDLYNSYGEYLYFEDDKACFYPAINSLVEITPHFLRSLICEALNCPEKSNWEQYNSIKYPDFYISWEEKIIIFNEKQQKLVR